jgi:hypothetical protein
VPIDFERLDAAITFAAQRPAEFEMRTWFNITDCGTTACLAGTVAIQAGWQPVFDPSAVFEFVERDGRTRPVWRVADELLGIGPDDGTDNTDIYGAYDLAEVIDIRNRWARMAGLSERTWDLP